MPQSTDKRARELAAVPQSRVNDARDRNARTMGDCATVHLEHHDVTFLSASRASLDMLNAYKQRMGWRFPWVSSQGSDFNRDFSAFNEQDRKNGTGANFGTPKRAAVNVNEDLELMALSAFALEGGVVYQTYTCDDRGTDVLHLVWQLLDRTPKGRDESAWKDWPLKHDEYGATPKNEPVSRSEHRAVSIVQRSNG